MNFVSVSYLVFLLIIVLIYYCIPKKQQWILLLFGSMLFYFCFSVKLAVFIFVSIVSSYLFTRFFKKSKKMLLFTVLFNLGILFILKVAASGTPLASRVHLDRFAFLLPVGISFYTLTIVSYMVDVYREKIEPEGNILKYSLYISFFPQILQGPIPRYAQLGKQLSCGHAFKRENLLEGGYLLLWGYFQKMVLADRLNIVVNTVFNGYQSYDGLYFLLAGVLYSFQLYLDFSGCVAIATGSAKLLGIELSKNFDHPYLAVSIKDFWHRWHITLSSFLRDYIYIPLGGNRRGKLRKWINIMVTFFLSGIWHGIGLHYIVWGLLHGLYQVLGEMLLPVKKLLMKITGTRAGSFAHILCSRLFTFFLVMIAWIFFRADSISQAVYMITHMFHRMNLYIFVSGELYTLGICQEEWVLLLMGALVLGMAAYMHQCGCNIKKLFMSQPVYFRWTILFAGIFAILIMGIYGPGYDFAQFIYGGF